MKKTERDYELAAKLSRLHDDMLIGSTELAAFLGVSRVSIQTGSVRVPDRVFGLSRKMQWRLGDVRTFVREQQTTAAVLVTSAVNRPGRPTKAQQVAKKGGVPQ